MAWAQPRKPFNFFVLGDWGRRGGDFQIPVANEMASVAAERQPSFVLTTGDNFYNFGVSSAKDSHWRESYEDIYSPVALGMPWYPILGNHDWGGDVKAQLDRTDNRWRMRGLWYKLGYADHQQPDLDIFMIDTVIWKVKEDFPYFLSGAKIPAHFSSMQKRWLEEELSRSTAKLKIVVGHHPIYSVGHHGGSKQLQDLDCLMKRTGVTLYICGHDHCLYRIRQENFHYICSGGGSEMLGDYTGGAASGCVLASDCPDPSNPDGKPVWNSFHRRAGFASFQIERNSIQFAFHGHTRREILERATLPARAGRDPAILSARNLID